MRKERKFFLATSFFVLLISILYITTVRSNPIEGPLTKRGYILDREGNPLVISREHYRAFLLIKKRGLIGDDLSPVIRKYLDRGLNLPEKGVFLLSDSLTEGEVEALRKEENVVVECSFERKVIHPFIEPLIGRVSNQNGVTGLEKRFDDILRDGKSLRLALSLDMIKRLSKLGKSVKDLEEVVVIKRNGELFGFYSIFPFPFFEKTFLIEPSLVYPYEFTTLEWELGRKGVQLEKGYLRVTPLHFVQAELRRLNGEHTSLTVLPRDEVEQRTSSFSSSEQGKPKEEILILPSYEKTIHLLSGRERIVLAVRNGLEPQKLLSLFVESGILK